MTKIRFFARRSLAKIGAIVVVTSSLLACLGAPAGAQASSKPIKIGLLGSYTGIFGSYGPKLIEAPVRLFLQQHGNKIAGREVELAIVDDQSKPDVMIEKARDLIENQKVDVIVGVVNSSGALAVRDYLARQKVVTLITVAAAKEMTQSRKSDPVFRVSFSSGQMEAAGAVLAKMLGIKSMVGIGADFVAPHQLLEALLDNFKKLGGTTPLVLWSPLGTADYSPYLTQIKNVADQTDAVSPMLFGPDAPRFFNQYLEFGMKKPLYVFGNVTEQTIFLDQVGDAAIGAKTYWNYSPYLDNPVNNAFRAAYRKAYNRLPGGFSMQAYAAMQFLDAAVTKIKGDINNFDALKKALETTTIESPAGPLFFDADHNVTYTVYLNEVKKGPDGIVAQMPLGPMITNVGQYQTIEEAQKNLTDLKNVKK
jgi:branched-chain amino acid transport system substrate-binding protein